MKAKVGDRLQCISAGTTEDFFTHYGSWFKPDTWYIVVGYDEKCYYSYTLENPEHDQMHVHERHIKYLYTIQQIRNAKLHKIENKYERNV